ncbi:myosin-like protein [Striga asiatica]|uniref:Myosin-like protein n=1 Tax=Striga asiatica TaxID=4170 RepID=A0A5A7R9M3_STRAF|nr:myosin-like protein [Striga asiatica]
MVLTNSTATRSSLELMLDKLQRQTDDQPKDAPPALPARPVSRARLPRARKPLQLDLHRRRSLEEIDAGSERAPMAMADGPVSFDRFQKGKNSKDTPENGILNLQKCYRGYKIRCYYKDLRTGVIAMQSFIRGENARTVRNCWIIKLKAIILIQRHIRMYFERRELKEKQAKAEQMKLAGKSVNLGQVEDIEVPYSVLIDLQKRILRAEAKVRRKKEENVGLRMQIQEMEGKWQQYEERMKFLEKAWQDELTNIQEHLAAANKNQASERNCPDFIITSHDGQRELLINEEDIDQINEIGLMQGCSILHPQDKLRKLKLKFKSWKKDYKIKLRDTRTMLKKLESSKTAKGEKTWWGRRTSN